MILIDQALQRLAARGSPLRVGLVGAGFSARVLAYQIMAAVPGLRLCAIANRTLSRARAAFEQAGIVDVAEADSARALDALVHRGAYAVCADPSILCESESVDVVVEATGTVPFGLTVVLAAIREGKHVVLMNVELDATLGPLLKQKADQAGVVYTNIDGDEPGVAMNLLRTVRSMGLRPVVAGNLKGFYDRYRTPDTQRAFANANGQKPSSATHFADGTKLSMELTVLANATGFRVSRSGLYGPTLDHVTDGSRFFADKLEEPGLVDFLLSTPPANGVFVVAAETDRVRKDYLKYLKLGDGPLYTFYRPYHLPQLEAPATIARAALFADAAVAPLEAPVCDTVAVAKRDLAAGETLDGLGGFTCYGMIVNAEDALDDGLLPMGLSGGCRLVRAVPRDRPVRRSDVALPAASALAMQYREQQDRMLAPGGKLGVSR